MIAIQENSSRDDAKHAWQTKFLELLPGIERQLRYAFRHVGAEARDEAVQEGK